jgi:hypothetical protein
MPARAKLPILIFLISMVGAVIVAAMGAFIVLGGYWENMAFLDRLSGPWRFREFVASPIPMSVHDVRGGYSGFPFGKIRTVFTFTDESLPFLHEWTQIEGPEAERKTIGANFPATKIFRKGRDKFLLINDNTKQGCLYVPGH